MKRYMSRRLLASLLVCIALLLPSCSSVSFREPAEQEPVTSGATDKPTSTSEWVTVAGMAAPPPSTHPDARNYYRPLSDYDKENIRFIINTLSHNSTLALAFQRSSLVRVGARTANIHPLRYLGFIFSDPELKGQIKNISRTPWNRFVDDFGDSLSNAVSRDNITDNIVADFAETVGIAMKKISSSIASEQWWAFMQALVNHVG